MTDNATIVGTDADDTINIQNDTVGRTVAALAGDDTVRATAQSDLLLGGWGDDTLYGSAGDDIIRGNDAIATVAPLAPASDAPSVATGPATIAFVSEDAGYQSAVGMYKIGADGTITDVQLLYERVEKNVLTAGETMDLDLSSGDTVGFFLVPNAWTIDERDAARDLLDPSLVYELRHPNSLEAGQVGAGRPLELWSMDPITGAPRLVGSEEGTYVYHTATDANPDGAVHARVTNNPDGTIEVSFEDLVNGGTEGADAFGDAVFIIDMNGNDVRVLGSPDDAYHEDEDGNVTIGGTLYAVADADTTVEVDGQAIDVVEAEFVEIDGVAHLVVDGAVVIGADSYAVTADDTGDTLGQITVGTDRYFVENGRTVTVDGTTHALDADGTFVVGGTTFTDADRLYGQDGDDIIYGGSGDDLVNGGNGDDQIRGEMGDDKLYGGDGVDTIRGSEGNDRIWGGNGDDALLNGGEGNDTVYGGAGDDLVRGGRGDDKLRGDDGNDRMLGDTGDDDLRGGAGDDRINGGVGADTLWGNGGDDLLRGGKDDDVLRGGDETPVDADATAYGEGWRDRANDDLGGGLGDDLLYGEAGHDRISGGVGDDRASGGTGNDFLAGASGQDWLFGDDAGLSRSWNADTSLGSIKNLAATTAVDTEDGGADLIVGGEGDDRMFGQGGDDDLRGNSGEDYIFGGHGDDRITAGDDADYVDGGAGDDRVMSGKGDDEMHGGDGNDLLCGQSGDDLAFGGEGQDQLIGHSGNDTMHGGDGDDALLGGSGDDVMHGDAGNDWMSGSSGVDTLHGGEGDDVLHGGSSGDFLNGDAGNDRLYGTSGNDTIDGGAGNDRLDGGTDDDVLTGGLGDDLLIGSDGADVLDGGEGADTLRAGKGNDVLTGGAGADTFEFTKTDRQIDEVDTITDFEAALDIIDLSGLGMSDSSKLSIVEDAAVTDGTLSVRTSEWTLNVDFAGGDAAATAALADLQDGTVPDWFVL